jgi:hypothetical protein
MPQLPKPPWWVVAGALMSISLHAIGRPATPEAAPDDDRLTVADIHGRAFRIERKGVYVSLSPGAAIEVDRPVKVGPKSRMDLRLKDGGTLELGPGAQVVLLPATREGSQDTRAIGLRLDGGYLRVVIPEQAGHTGLEVSSARWQAQLQPGEYVFETQGAESSLCTLSGAMRLSGLPEGVGTPQARDCVHVTRQAPEVAALTSADWEVVQKRRTLLPALAHAGEPAKPAADVATLVEVPRTSPAPPADALIASTAPAALGLGTMLASAPGLAPADADPGGEWIINVETYASLESAEQQAAKLRAQNIQATIRNETVRGRSSYRVVVEGLATEIDAHAMRDRLVSTLGMRQAWVFRKY